MEQINDNLNFEQSASQKRRILAHLQEGKAITQMDALRVFGCFRLAARIAELRKEGYNISTHKVCRNGKYFAAYVMDEIDFER